MREQDFKWKVDNKMPGDFGITEFDKLQIRINKKIHNKAKKNAKTEQQKKDALLINTLVHERLHARDPLMDHDAVYRISRVAVEHMSRKEKKALYDKIKNK